MTEYKGSRKLSIVFLLLILFISMQIYEEKISLPDLQSLRGNNNSVFETNTQKQPLQTQISQNQTKLKDELVEMATAHEKDEVVIAELQKKLENSKKEIGLVKSSAEEEKSELQKQLDAAPPASLSSTLFDPQEICAYFPSDESFSATRLWQKYLPLILEASKNPLMPDLLTDDETAKMRTLLEETLSPSRMRRAVRHMPTFSHHIVKNVVEIIQKRIQDPQNNPPLRVAVFGGSVTIGRDCHMKKMSYLNCAWPKRFELLLNQFAKMDIIKIYNLGIGGTGSATATNRVKYWMYGSDKDLMKVGPDVIINSYSTNDS